MARWKLNSPHYINLASHSEISEWEYEETNRETNRRQRKRFPVPALLDTADPACFNYPGMIIVANAPSPLGARDYIYLGPPTPEMEPIDEEAKAITDAESKNWVHPIEALPGQGFNQSLLAGLEKQLGELITVASTGRAAVVEGGVTKSEFEELKQQMAELMKQNAALQAKALESTPARR